MTRQDMAGKRVLVTAAAAGIGATIATRFAEAGARVFICDVDGETVAAYLAAHPRSAGFRPTSLSRPMWSASSPRGGARWRARRAREQRGRRRPAAPVEEMDVEGWRRTLDVNLTGAFLCVRAAVPHLKAAGGGSIAIMSSNAGTMGLPYRGPYVASNGVSSGS